MRGSVVTRGKTWSYVVDVVATLAPDVGGSGGKAGSRRSARPKQALRRALAAVGAGELRTRAR